MLWVTRKRHFITAFLPMLISIQTGAIAVLRWILLLRPLLRMLSLRPLLRMLSFLSVKAEGVAFTVLGAAQCTVLGCEKRGGQYGIVWL